MDIGVDIGGTCVKVAALRDGKELWKGQSLFYSRPTTQELVAAISQAAEGWVKEIQCVGICVPGMMDPDLGVVKVSVNVPGLVDQDLRGIVGAGLGGPVRRLAVLSDALASALDIHSQRGVQGRLVVLALGTGVGAAVLDDGVPLRVDGDSPGHWGQVDVSLEGEPVIGPDGGRGGLEGYIGLPALRKRYGDDVEAALARLSADAPPIRALARAIRIAHAIYCPHHICLLGGVGIRLGHILPQLRRLVETDLTRIARAGWGLSIGDDAFHAARGAARFAASSGSA